MLVSLLVREPEVDSELGIDEALETFCLVDVLQRLQISSVKLDRSQILLNPGWCHRLGQHDMAFRNLLADQNGPGANFMLLGHIRHAFFLKQRAAGTSQWTICLDQDPFLLAEV